MSKFWTKVLGAVIIAIALGGATAVIRNGNRISRLEVHIPYIRKALERIEKRLEVE